MLDFKRRLIAGAADWLAPGGLLLIETGLPQGDRTCAEMNDA